MTDWLESFLEYTSYGETPPKIMYWVGVCTIAGALRRKVWIDEDIFQWSPNFYLLIVGPPGSIKKSTSIGQGMRLLKQVPEIDFGPQIVTWQALITHIAGSKREWNIKGVPFEASCVTIALSEFGSFFDPTNRELVDALTDMWDGKLETIVKETKTNGSDEIVNPWINIMACTTPEWIAQNFPKSLIGSGFGSRPILLYADKPLRDVAYPTRNMPICGTRRAEERALVDGLRTIADYAGEVRLTERAYKWGEAWYADYRKQQRANGRTIESGFWERKQTHLHKLAMVISAARGKFPTIDVEEMIEADYRIKSLEEDVSQIYGFIGQTESSKIAGDLVETLTKVGPIEKKELYRRYFFRSMGSADFDAALKSALASGLVVETGSVAKPIIELRS